MKNLFNRKATTTTTTVAKTNDSSLLENILVGFGVAAVALAAATSEYAEQENVKALDDLRASRGDVINHQTVTYKLRNKDVAMKGDINYIKSVLDALNRIYSTERREAEFNNSSIVFTGTSISKSFKELLEMRVISKRSYGGYELDYTIRMAL